MYLARNSNGCLFLHSEKPIRRQIGSKGWWESTGGKMEIKSKAMHPRWQDEPIPVSLQADWINESIKD